MSKMDKLLETLEDLTKRVKRTLSMREQEEVETGEEEIAGEDPEIPEEVWAWIEAAGTDVEADEEVGGNPPVWAVDKAIWKRAKKQVRRYWERYDEPYAVVTAVYKSMGGRIRRGRRRTA